MGMLLGVICLGTRLRNVVLRVGILTSSPDCGGEFLEISADLASTAMLEARVWRWR